MTRHEMALEIARVNKEGNRKFFLATINAGLEAIGIPHDDVEAKKVVTALKERLESRYSEVENLVANITEEAYTHKELTALYNFYCTAEGHSVLMKMPIAGQRGFEAGSAWAGNIINEIFKEHNIDIKV